MNISSVIVGARPGAVVSVMQALQTFAGVEVHHAEEDGRMIVTVETEGDGATADTFEAISRLPDVLSASMVYHQYESDPDEEA